MKNQRIIYRKCGETVYDTNFKKLIKYDQHYVGWLEL